MPSTRSSPETPAPVQPTPSQPIQSAERPKIENVRKERWWQHIFGAGGQPPQPGPADDLREDRQKIDQARREIREALPGKVRHPEDVADLVNIIETVDAKTWRDRRLEEKYGRGTIGYLKRYISGEEDFYYNNLGTQYDGWRELARRALRILTDRRIIIGAGVSIAASVLSGGAAAAASVAFMGGLIGRTLGEGVEAVYGKSRDLRMQIARRHYQELVELKDLARKMRETHGDQEKVNYVNQIIDKVYCQDQFVVGRESKITKDEKKWDRVKGVLTTAGSLSGLGYSLYHGFSELSQPITETVRYYDFDGDGIGHAIKEINGQYWYHENDSAGHAIDTLHKLGTMGPPYQEFVSPSSEMWQNIHHIETVKNTLSNQEIFSQMSRDVGWGAGTVFGMAFGHSFKGDAKNDRAEMEQVRRELQAQVPATKGEETRQEATEAGFQPLIDQIYTFDEALTKMHREGKPPVVKDMLQGGQEIYLPANCQWKVVSLSRDRKEVALENQTTPPDATGRRQRVALKYQELREKGKLVPTAEEKEKAAVQKDITELKKKWDEGKTIIEFRSKLDKDFFSKNALPAIDTKAKYEILAPFDPAENKISIRNVATGERHNDLNLSKLIDAIGNLKSSTEEEKKKEEAKGTEYDELKKKFKKSKEQIPSKGSIWYFKNDLTGFDEEDENEEIIFKKGFYRIIESPNKEKLEIEIAGIGERAKLKGKIKMEGLLDDKYNTVEYLVEKKLEEKETAGASIPSSKEIKKDQTWSYRYTTAPKPDPAAQKYRITRVDEKTGFVSLLGNDPTAPPPPPAPPKITRVIDQIELAENGTFVP